MIKVKRPTDWLTQQIKRNILLYGPPGQGKTWLAASSRNPIMLATDPQGPISLLSSPSLRNTPFIEITTPADLEEAKKAVLGKSADFAPFETIILDTISTAQTYDLRELRKDVRNAQGKASQNEWALTNQHMSDTLFDLLTKANKSVIVVAHDKKIRMKNEQNDNVLVAIEPSVTPGTWETCQRLFSGIYYYTIAQAKPTTIRRLYLGSGKTKAITKDRYGLPESFDNPTWQTIEDAQQKLIDRINNES